MINKKKLIILTILLILFVLFLVLPLLELTVLSPKEFSIDNISGSIDNSYTISSSHNNDQIIFNDKYSTIKLEVINKSKNKTFKNFDLIKRPFKKSTFSIDDIKVHEREKILDKNYKHHVKQMSFKIKGKMFIVTIKTPFSKSKDHNYMKKLNNDVEEMISSLDGGKARMIKIF